MDAMNSPAKLKTSFKSVLAHLKAVFPGVSFKPSDSFRWSAEKNTIYYDVSAEDPVWSLLHEAGHMMRGHSVYNSDYTLVRMEVEAWDSARKLANELGIVIDDDYIEDCIDSYRNWQFKRSSCPACAQTGVEKTNGHYICINCRNTWDVSTNRFCRVYRRSSDIKKGALTAPDSKL